MKPSDSKLRRPRLKKKLQTSGPKTERKTLSAENDVDPGQGSTAEEVVLVLMKIVAILVITAIAERVTATTGIAIRTGTMIRRDTESQIGTVILTATKAITNRATMIGEKNIAEAAIIGGSTNEIGFIAGRALDPD